MDFQEFEKNFLTENPNTDPVKQAEALKFLYEFFQKGVKNICDIVISKYDAEIAQSKQDIFDAQKAIRELEVKEWQNGLS